MAVAVSLFLLALALSADAFAVALGQGAAVRTHAWRSALTVGAAFGVAQALAPLAGWGLGLMFASVIAGIDHWVAFVLLAGVGAKMLWEGFRGDLETNNNQGVERVVGGWALFALAVATSIDAAAAGIALPTLGAPVLVSVAVIGGVTFVLSTMGVWIGRFGARSLGARAEIVGGLVLIGIGVKVLVDHGVFGDVFG